MKTIKLQNIKCIGCKNTVTKALEKAGVKNITLDIQSGVIRYEYTGDDKNIIGLLTRLGYPEAGSDESNSLKIKAKSYISCAIGKFN